MWMVPTLQEVALEMTLGGRRMYIGERNSSQAKKSAKQGAERPIEMTGFLSCAFTAEGV